MTSSTNARPPRRQQRRPLPGPAHANATQLDNATLIYASTEAETATHRTPDGTTLHVEALSLDGEPDEVLEEISEIAARLRERRAVRPLVAIA